MLSNKDCFVGNVERFNINLQEFVAGGGRFGLDDPVGQRCGAAPLNRRHDGHGAHCGNHWRDPMAETAGAAQNQGCQGQAA